MRLTPRLRTFFFFVNVLILLLPLGGIVLMRLYESVLIRRTEIELIFQGAHVAAAYGSAIRESLTKQGEGPLAAYGVPARPEFLPRDDSLRPVEAKLDLAADAIWPPPVAARKAPHQADPIARRAGQRITPAMRDAQRVTLAGIRVVDYRGVVVATTRTELGQSLAHREEVWRALQGENVAAMRARISDEPPPPLDSISRGTQLRVFVAMPVVEGGRVWGAVVLSRTPQAVSQSLYTLRWYIVGGAVVLLAMLLLISVISSRTITRPMEELIRQSERVASGERGAATPLSRAGALEVRKVSEAVARMAQALEERADYINTFARGVSHEFKTPLASMRGTVELLRDHLDEMTTEEREQFLGNLEQDCERLTRLVSRLAELARADVIKPTASKSALGPTIDELTARFGAEQLKLEVEHGEGVGEVRMARETLETIVTNLIDNARQHGGPEVSIKISSALREAEAGAERPMIALLIEDDGPGISEANLKKVFDRFFTTARHRGGSGLGLNIVKKLANVHGGDITVESQPGRTVFCVTLPAG